MTNIVIARTLGPTGKGVLSLLGYALFVSSSLAALGMQAAAVQMIGKGRHAKQEISAAVTLISLLAGTASMGLTLLLLPGFRGNIPLTPLMVVGTSILVVTSVLKSNLGGLFLALGRIGTFNLVVSLPALLWMAGSVLVLGLLGWGIDEAVVVWFLVHGGVALLAIALALRLAPPMLAGVGRPLRSCLAFGLPSYSANLLWVLVLKADGFLLAAQRSAAEVGIYSVAVLIAEVVLYVPRSLSLALHRRFAAGDSSGATRLAARAARNSGALALAASPVIAFGAVVGIPTVFGAPFRASILPLLWLLPGIVAVSFASPLVLYLVQHRGKPLASAVAGAIGLAVNVVGCLVWIPQHGPTGAAWASSVAYLVHAAMVVVFFRRQSAPSPASLLWPRRSDLRDWVDLLRESAGFRRWR